MTRLLSVEELICVDTHVRHRIVCNVQDTWRFVNE
jgi:hypothetical protein